MSKKDLIFPALFYTTLSVVILWKLLLPGYIPQSAATIGPTFYMDTFKDWFNLYNITFYTTSLLLPTWITQKLALFMLISGVGLSMHLSFRSLTKQFSYPKWIPYLSGFLYIFNPFFYTRILIGHNNIVMGYILMPLVISALFQLQTARCISFKNIVDCLRHKKNLPNPQKGSEESQAMPTGTKQKKESDQQISNAQKIVKSLKYFYGTKIIPIKLTVGIFLMDVLLSRKYTHRFGAAPSLAKVVLGISTMPIPLPNGCVRQTVIPHSLDSLPPISLNRNA